LAHWVELVKKSYGPSKPESLRKVVSSAIGQSWRALLDHYSSNDSVVGMEFWLLLVELLQDYNIDCRNEAAKCVNQIMCHIEGLISLNVIVTAFCSSHGYVTACS